MRKKRDIVVEVLETENGNGFTAKKVRIRNKGEIVNAFVEYKDSRGYYMRFHYDDDLREATLDSIESKVVEVVIPSTVLNYRVAKIGDRARKSDEILSISFPDTIVSIGDDALCYGYLESINIPDSIIAIGRGALSYTDLKEIFIPHSVLTIGEGAFCNCNKLVSIKVDVQNPCYDSRENCNAIISTKDDRMIIGCQKTHIPRSIKEIGNNAFEGCDLTNISFPKSLVKIGADAFKKCNGLMEIFIPYNIAQIASGCFSDCKRLSRIRVSKKNKYYDSRNSCNAIIETSTNSLIQGCANTVIPDNTSIIGQGAFQGCLCFFSIVIPDSVTRIEKDAFAGCFNLEEIVLSNKLSMLGDGALSGTSLDSIELPNTLVELEDSVFGVSHPNYLKVCEGNKKYDSRNNCNALIETETNKLLVGTSNTVIPESVEEIESFAFSFTKITEINIPKSVHTIKEFAFLWCSDLKRITIRDPSLLEDAGVRKDVVETITYNH